jgi:hypothetical protein
VAGRSNRSLGVTRRRIDHHLNMSLTAHDTQLFKRYVEGLLSYEDALRQADSANDVRLAIKLHLGPGWLDEDDDDDGAVVQSVQPKKPNPSLGSYATPPKGKQGDT